MPIRTEARERAAKCLKLAEVDPAFSPQFTVLAQEWLALALVVENINMIVDQAEKDNRHVIKVSH